MEWLWLFCFYSFLGYLLERMFAKITASPRQVRKGFLLLPLCPAYGLAMVADLAASSSDTPCSPTSTSLRMWPSACGSPRRRRAKRR